MHTIGQVSKIAGCSVESIRHYERIGLIPKPDRNASGHRRYEKKHILSLQFIRLMRCADFSLKDIKKALENLKDDFSCEDCGYTRSLIMNQARYLKKKREELFKHEKVLEKIKGLCSNCDHECLHGNKVCPLIEFLGLECT